MKENRKRLISIILVWLSILSIVTGVLLGYKNNVLFLTPWCFLMYLAIIFWNSSTHKNLILGSLLVFVLGTTVEVIGVNYKEFFGEYEYGENLGLKLFGIPLSIGINWIILVYCTSAISEKINKNIFISSILGSLLFVSLDIVVDVSAARFDFWTPKDQIPSFQEYIHWIIAVFFVHLVFLKIYRSFNYTLSFHMFLAMFIFPLIFVFF